jgi:hypothetical protein
MVGQFTDPREGTLHIVRTRIYGVDKEGNKVLLHRPGDLVTGEEAERVACLADPEPPAKRPLGGMKLTELRKIVEDEEINPKGCNTRKDFILAICRERGRRQAKPTTKGS